MKTITTEQLRFKRALIASINYLKKNYSDNLYYVPTIYCFENGGWKIKTMLVSNINQEGQVTLIDEWGDCTGEVHKEQWQQYSRPSNLRTDDVITWMEIMLSRLKDQIDEREYQDQE